MVDQLGGSKNLQNNKLILVGVISRAHGIKGQVLVKSYTEPVENIANLSIIDKEQNSVKLKILQVKQNSNLVCKIEDCDNRNLAETLRGLELYCLRSDFPIIAEQDEFYVEDLIGLDVLNHKRDKIGIIVNILNYGAGDIIEIRFLDQKATQMFPFSQEFFPEIGDDYVFLAKKC